ncbi:MAG: TraB/GumN family protein [Pyrinomonadaceae bacterium]|nr:TraB/GumN family protein [Pyrinomonadaceae bacterium]
MKKILSLFALFLAFIAFNFNALAQTAKPVEARGLLYKISGKNLEKPSYIYGTIHIICQNDMFGMDKLKEYISQSNQVLMELDLDDPATMQAMTGNLAMPDGKTLKDYLTDEQYAKVDEMFKKYTGISVDLVKSYRPMLSSVMISTSPKAINCQAPGSYDLTFSQFAASKKIPVLGLESVNEQFEAIDKKPMATQAKELYEMALDPNKAIMQMAEMLEIYKEQDSEKLYKFTNGNLGEVEFEKVMLDNRNANWIPKIEKAIAEKTTFIAVGGGHLGGENGVLNRLKKQGYTIEAIKF